MTGKSLDDAIYLDRKIFCRCGFYVGNQLMDGQILLLESGLVAFNYLSFQCPNGHNSSWLSPLLPNEKETVDNCAPNVKHIERRAAGIAKHFNAVRRRENYGIYHRADGKFIVTVGAYVGTFETHDEAVKVRDAELKEKMQKLGYKAKQKNPDNQSPQTAAEAAAV